MIISGNVIMSDDTVINRGVPIQDFSTDTIPIPMHSIFADTDTLPICNE